MAQRAIVIRYFFLLMIEKILNEVTELNILSYFA